MAGGVVGNSVGGGVDGAVDLTAVAAALLPRGDEPEIGRGERREPPLAAMAVVPQAECAGVVGTDVTALAQVKSGDVVQSCFHDGAKVAPHDDT